MTLNTPFQGARPLWAPKRFPDAEMWHVGPVQLARYDDNGTETVRIGSGSEAIFLTAANAELFLDAAHAALRIPRCFHRPLTADDGA